MIDIRDLTKETFESAYKTMIKIRDNDEEVLISAIDFEKKIIIWNTEDSEIIVPFELVEYVEVIKEGKNNG